MSFAPADLTAKAAAKAGAAHLAGLQTPGSLAPALV